MRYWTGLVYPKSSVFRLQSFYYRLVVVLQLENQNFKVGGHWRIVEDKSLKNCQLVKYHHLQHQQSEPRTTTTLPTGYHTSKPILGLPIISQNATTPDYELGSSISILALN
ncbi:hypothetical protein GMOD_00008433 [Pyrenophora seminiperda CCB06]|uniref:Uncharacterized protein n=1 Tax=Pyrenophora seminiperda CCB06 TaxID=1302712 RepID=A0A3M7M8L9_9PLEO|nr:hypothetical protein GMOD_00008433 [Pyrenophora seminiperda CCB06]